MLLDMSSIDYKKEKSMSDCKIYPADTVDIYGNVWPTVGENIRNGIFGKLKVAKIKIDGTNITSSDLKVSSIQEKDFVIDKKAIFIIVDKVYMPIGNIRIFYFERFSLISTSYKLQDVKADISVLYTEY